MLKAVLAKTVVLAFILAVAVVSGCTSTSNRQPLEMDKALQDHIQLGLNYIGEGNRKMARTHLLKALEIDKRSPGAHHAMALLLQIELEDELAEEHFKKAIAYDRDFSRARNNYGVFLFKQQRYQDAYKQFKEAGDDVNYDLRPQVFYSLGVTAELLGKSDEAEKAWRKSLALAPRYGPPYLELGEHYFNQEKFSLARKYLDAFDTLSRPQPRSLWLAVRIEHHFGNKDGVASKGLALKKLFPDSDETLRYQEWLKNEAKR